VDGGLRTVSAEHLSQVRRRAASAVQAVYRDLGLADYDDERVDEVVVANGSRDLSPGHPKIVAEAAAAIEAKHLTVFDVVASLKRTGFDEEADAIMRLTRERLRGDQLQTSAIFDENFRVLSKITDPNDYTGPGTGYTPTEQRRAEIENIRQERTIAELTADQDEHRGHISITAVEPAQQGTDPHCLADPVRPDRRRGAAPDRGRTRGRRLRAAPGPGQVHDRRRDDRAHRRAAVGLRNWNRAARQGNRADSPA
jgi:propanediol dehydratase large subunit